MQDKRWILSTHETMGDSLYEGKSICKALHFNVETSGKFQKDENIAYEIWAIECQKQLAGHPCDAAFTVFAHLSNFYFVIFPFRQYPNTLTWKRHFSKKWTKCATRQQAGIMTVARQKNAFFFGATIFVSDFQSFLSNRKISGWKL